MALKPSTKPAEDTKGKKQVESKKAVEKPVETSKADKPVFKQTAKMPTKKSAKHIAAEKAAAENLREKKRIERTVQSADKHMSKLDTFKLEELADEALDKMDKVAEKDLGNVTQTTTVLQAASVPKAPEKPKAKETPADASKLSWDEVQKNLRQRQATLTPSKPRPDFSAYLKH